MNHRSWPAFVGAFALATLLGGVFLWMIPPAAAREVKAACEGIEARTVAPGALCDRASCQLPMMAPDFSVAANDGNSFTLSSLRGKVVLLNFWASWCGTCKMEKPSLARFARAAPADLKVVTLASDAEWAKVVLAIGLSTDPLKVSQEFRTDKPPVPTLAQAIAEYGRAAPKGTSYAVYLDPPVDGTDDVDSTAVGKVATAWGVTKVPESFLIDREGRIRYYLVNKRDWSSAVVQTCAESLLDE